MKSTVSSSHAEAFVKAGRAFTNAMSTVLIYAMLIVMALVVLVPIV